MAAVSGVRWRDRALLAYRQGPEHPAKIRIVRWLAHGLTGGRICVNYADGATIAIDPADWIGWAILTEGNYEPASLLLALRIMAREPGLFVDVGANCGWYTCAVARLADCTVIAIEPDCGNCTRLRGNVELAELANVAVFNGAVGAGFDAVEMIHRARGNSGTAAVRSRGETPGADGHWVATVPLNALLARLARPQRPVLVKIDVEGFEAQALAGLDFDGPFRPRNILMEFDPQLAGRSWESIGAMQAFFASKGYDAVDVRGRPLQGTADLPESNVWLRECETEATGA